MDKPIGSNPLVGRFGFVRHTWFKVLLIGLFLFGVVDGALYITANPNLVPTAIILGAFLVPVTFVLYLYQHMQHLEIPLPSLAMTFLFGGAIAIVVAALLEWQTLRSLSLVSLLGVGLVEESAKLLFPIFIYLRGRYRHEADGLLFGFASGMGFATLETMGYSLTALIQANGDVGALDGTLFVRGLLSPVGHAAWTGYVCAVIWFQREKGRRLLPFNMAVVGAFIVAVLLHTSWDVLGSITKRTSIGAVAVDYAGLFAVALVSLLLLTRKISQALANQPKGEEPPGLK